MQSPLSAMAYGAASGSMSLRCIRHTRTTAQQYHRFITMLRVPASALGLGVLLLRFGTSSYAELEL